MSDRTPMRQLRRAARIPVLRMGLFGLAAALLLALPASGYGKSDASGSAKKDQLEVFSWWTGGGEAHGLAKLGFIFVNRENLCAFLGEAHRGRAAVAPAGTHRAGAGHDCHAVLESHWNP